jgi:hypothetical protein
MWRTKFRVVQASRVGFFLADARDIAMRPALRGSIYKFSTTSLSDLIRSGSARDKP